MDTSPVRKRGRPSKSPKQPQQPQQQQPTLESRDRDGGVREGSGDSSRERSESAGSEDGVGRDRGRLRRRRSARNDDSSSDSDFSPHNAAARKSLSNVKVQFPRSLKVYHSE